MEVKTPLSITNIHRGKQERNRCLYGTLHDADGVVLINATMDYIVRRIPQILQPTTKPVDRVTAI